MKVAVSYLLYLTKENYSRRYNIVEKSSQTFTENFKNQNCEIIIVNNGDYNLIPDCLKQFRILNLEKNYFDIAVHYSGLFLAQKLNIKYFSYFYDDFFYFNNNFLNDCSNFLNENNIHSMRLPKYEVRNREYYSTDITPKQVNADAVRHENGANNELLYQLQFGETVFYKTNWKPNSRPMMWNTKNFSENYSIITDNHPVMQVFEKHLYNISDQLSQKNEYISSFLDQGVCVSSPVEASERTRVSNHYRDIFVSTKKLKEEFDNLIV